MGRIRKQLRELRRRGVFATAALYAIGAWVVLQVASLAFPGWGIPDAAIRYVWIAALLLSPVALIVGWRYDVTADGITRTPTSAGEPRDIRRADWILLALLGVACSAVFAGVTLRVLDMREAIVERETAPQTAENSIAVLPFADLSAEPGNDYFSDGITEQLRNELSRIHGLHVAARTSSFYYKNRNEPVIEIGRSLGVRSLLEGSVRKDGDMVRVTAQLIDAETGYQLWSQTWDREFQDIFVVQDEIARRISQSLQVRLRAQGLPAIDRGGTLSAEAYDLYLRAIAERHETTEGAIARSNELLDRALAIDPDFALALDALAYGYLIEAWTGTRPWDMAMKEAARLLTLALDEESELEQAHATLGLLASMARNFEEANARYERALEINPNYFTGHVNYGLSLVHQARLKEASAAYYRALALDRMNGDLAFNLGSLLMLQGQFDDGRDMLERSLVVQPGSAIVHAALTHWSVQYGELSEAVRRGRATFADHPDSLYNNGALLHAYRLVGLHDEARAFQREVAAAQPDSAVVEEQNMSFALATGDVATFATLARERYERLDASPGDPLNSSARNVVRDFGLALLLQRQDAEAARVLNWAAGGEEGIARTTYDDMGVLKLLALALQRSDREDDAQALIDHCLKLALEARENGWATPVLSVRLAEIYLLKGDHDAALAELALAVEKGFRDVGWIEHLPYWQALRSDHRLEELTVVMLDNIEAERRVLANVN